MAYYDIEDITIGGLTIDIHVEGPEERAEKAAMDLNDRAARIGQAFEEGKLPDECDGIGISIDWEGVIAGEYPKGEE